MACTYDPTLPDNLSWVRFLTGDTDVPDGCILEDEEILALLAESVACDGSGKWTKYCAAAEAAGAMQAVASSASGEVIEKAVGRLRLRFDTGGGTDSVFSALRRDLSAKCAWLMTPLPRSFASMGKTRCRPCRGGGS